MKKYLILFVLFFFVLNCSAFAEDTKIPWKYKKLYNELDAKLDEINNYLDSVWNKKKHNTVFTLESMMANSNRGEVLLKPVTFNALILELDRFNDIGAKGVALSISYPVLSPTFPKSKEYLNFYKKVASEIRKRNFKLIIETTTIFPDKEFSNINPDYSKLTLNKYMQEKRYMAETIIRELKPDYLTIENEPETVKRNTGVELNVESFTNLVNYVLNGLDTKGVKIGAGAGTWDNLAYFESLARNTNLDYIDIHIYPIQNDYFINRTIKITNIARKYNKNLTIGESGLYKASLNEMSYAVANVPALFARDNYSFWAPLDQKFLEAIFKLSNYLDIDFCSYFWSKYFWGYMDYNWQTAFMSPMKLNSIGNKNIYKNMREDNLSPTGKMYKILVK